MLEYKVSLFNSRSYSFTNVFRVYINKRWRQQNNVGNYSNFKILRNIGYDFTLAKWKVH